MAIKKVAFLILAIYLTPLTVWQVLKLVEVVENGPHPVSIGLGILLLLILILWSKGRPAA